MSGWPHGSDSALVNQAQDSKETVFCKFVNFPKISFNSQALINKSLKMCANTNNFLLFSVVDNSSSLSEVSLELNPVGSLQELCIARHCPFPIYTFPVKKLKEHKEEFRIVCSISIYECSGTGISKQVAKNQAAYLMYKQIEKLTSEDLKQIWKNEYEYKGEIPCDSSLLQHHKLPHSIKFAKFALSHESATHLKFFFDSSAPKTPHLQKIKKNPTASNTLNTILKIEDITLKCLTASCNFGKVEVMMQVNTIPIIVISGSGKSVSEAQESAACVILSYFKYKLNIQ